MPIELRAKLRPRDYGDAIWFLFCAGIFGYPLREQLKQSFRSEPFSPISMITSLFQHQPLVTSLTILMLLLSFYSFQAKRGYSLSLDNDILTKRYRWPFGLFNKQVALKNLPEPSIESVLRWTGKNTQEYLAFVFRPNPPPKDTEEVMFRFLLARKMGEIIFPLPVGRDEQNSGTFIAAVRKASRSAHASKGQ